MLGVLALVKIVLLVIFFGFYPVRTVISHTVTRMKAAAATLRLPR